MRIKYAHSSTEAILMHQIYNSQAPKKPTNVSINSDLLEKAKRLNINLSATLEQALTEQVRAGQCEQWKRENAKAIKSYNHFIEENGTFGDSTRKF
jgi:antitoxin CcdA